MARGRVILAALLCAVAAVGTAATARGGIDGQRPVRVVLGSRVIDLFHATSVQVSGMTTHEAAVRLIGGTDERGLAYRWTPYPWQELRSADGGWRGLLPAPALPGIYQIQLRLDHGRELLTSSHWLLRVFPHGTMSRRPSPTAAGAVGDFVARLPGNQALVALRRWPQAEFDHRDPRLHRIFVIAYAPRGDDRPGSRLGLFVTTVRNGFHGRWRVLQATTEPYDSRALSAPRGAGG